MYDELKATQKTAKQQTLGRCTTSAGDIYETVMVLVMDVHLRQQKNCKKKKEERRKKEKKKEKRMRTKL